MTQIQGCASGLTESSKRFCNFSRKAGRVCFRFFSPSKKIIRAHCPPTSGRHQIARLCRGGISPSTISDSAHRVAFGRSRVNAGHLPRNGERECVREKERLLDLNVTCTCCQRHVIDVELTCSLSIFFPPHILDALVNRITLFAQVNSSLCFLSGQNKPGTLPLHRVTVMLRKEVVIYLCYFSVLQI